MKKYNVYCLLVLLSFQACKKPAQSDIQTIPEPYVRPIGTPIQGKVVKRLNIGPEGGSLISADGVLTLQVPAGAIEHDQVFEIQEITSTLEGNNYPTYKLSPEWVKFVKPVQIHFNYQNADLRGSSADMLAPAYQDEKGIYHAPKQFINDKANKKIVVNTTHFSSWTIYDNYRLEGPTEVGTEGNIRIKLMTYPQIPDLTGDDSLQPWDEAKVISQFGYVDEKLKSAEWKITGEGGITPEGLKCLYTAPFDLPSTNPVLVSVSMVGKFESNGPSTAKYTLLYPVTIVSDVFFTATIDGVKHNVTSPAFVKFPGSFTLTGLVDGRRFLTLMVNDLGKGSYAFGILNQPGQAHLSYGYDNTNFVQSFRSSCSPSDPDIVLSPGKVNITSFPEYAGAYIGGNVSGAILYHQYDYCSNQVRKNVSVAFNVRTY
jgi:hypothetical protein